MSQGPSPKFNDDELDKTMQNAIANDEFKQHHRESVKDKPHTVKNRNSKIELEKLELNNVSNEHPFSPSKQRLHDENNDSEIKVESRSLTNDFSKDNSTDQIKTKINH